MAEVLTLYKCNNEACTLGSIKDPGHFTGGMTAESKNLLTGIPVESLEEGKDYGEGVCPNCGTKGEEVGTHQSHVGTDDETEVDNSEDGA